MNRYNPIIKLLCSLHKLNVMPIGFIMITATEGGSERQKGIMKTVQELAKAFEVSDQTIRNEIKRQKIKCLRNADYSGGVGFCVLDEDAALIERAIKERREQKPKSNLKQKAEETKKQNIKDLVLQLEQKQKHIDDLETKLAAKDDQIALIIKEYTEQIKVLTASLENITENLKAAQILHAETIQNRIEQHNDRKWWQFWKH